MARELNLAERVLLPVAETIVGWCVGAANQGPTPRTIAQVSHDTRCVCRIAIRSDVGLGCRWNPQEKVRNHRQVVRSLPSVLRMGSKTVI